MFNAEYNKLIIEGCDYLRGTCDSINYISHVLEEKLEALKTKYPEECMQNMKSEGYSYFDELFQDDVDEALYESGWFCCEQCNWWCDDSSGHGDNICSDCHDENEDEE